MPEPTFTGERVIPGAVEADLWNEHVSRYHFASLFAARRSVLDVGCGAGYGTELLAREAASCVGFDIAVDAVQYAAAHHANGTRFFAASASAFPLGSGSFELITAFEVIEHIPEWRKLVDEAARVLKSNGVFLVSTPNKVYYSETRKEAGPNPFHVHEFEFMEFQQALKEVFPFVLVLAQNQQEAVVFAPDEPSTEVRGAIASVRPLEEAHFFLGVCSHERMSVPAFTYVPSAANLLHERELYIESLKGELSEARTQHLTLLDAHRKLQDELETQNRWALSLDREIENDRSRIAELQADMDQLRNVKTELDRIMGSRWCRLGRRFGFMQQK